MSNFRYNIFVFLNIFLAFNCGPVFTHKHVTKMAPIFSNENRKNKNCCLGRQQFTSLLLDPIDGLPLIPDDIQDRMQQMSIEHKV